MFGIWLCDQESLFEGFTAGVISGVHVGTDFSYGTLHHDVRSARTSNNGEPLAFEQRNRAGMFPVADVVRYGWIGLDEPAAPVPDRPERRTQRNTGNTLPAPANAGDEARNSPAHPSTELRNPPISDPLGLSPGNGSSSAGPYWHHPIGSPPSYTRIPCAWPAITSARFSAWFWTRSALRFGYFAFGRWQPRWKSMQAQNAHPLPGANRRSKSGQVSGPRSLVSYVIGHRVEMAPSSYDILPQSVQRLFPAVGQL
jgi:hypothetical protein